MNNVTIDTNVSERETQFKRNVRHAPKWPKLITEGLDQRDLDKVLPFKPSGSQGPAKLHTLSLNEIQPEVTQWLWEPFLPLGEMTLIQGNPGVGKSQLSLDIAMRVAMGLPWPEQTSVRIPGPVLLLPGEDHVAKTVRPRLDALGLDETGRCRIEVASETFSFDEAGVEKLDRTLLELQPALVIVDPLAVYLGGKLDMNRQNQVRATIGPIGKLAQEHGCAIALVHHTRKAQGGKAIHQSIGSVDFVAAVRSAVSVYEYDGNVVMAHAKHNLSGKGSSLAYGLDNKGLHWLGPVQVTADELAASPEEREKRSLKQQAMQWLKDFLEVEGTAPAEEMFEQGRAAGYSPRTLESAKAELGVKSKKEGSRWWWYLPSVGKTAERQGLCTLAALQPS